MPNYFGWIKSTWNFFTRIKELERRVSKLETDVDGLLAAQKETDPQLAARRQWERTRKKYELREVFPGTKLYVLRDNPTQQVCARCFEERERLITLQGVSRHFVKCPSCSTAYQIAEVTEIPVLQRRNYWNRPFRPPSH